MKKEQELNRKLAEWAGLQDVQVLLAWDNTVNKIQTEVPESNPIRYQIIEPFTRSLDACFKWLAPKAIRLIGDRCKITPDRAMQKLFNLWLQEYWEEFMLESEALCLAIEKLIEEA